MNLTNGNGFYMNARKGIAMQNNTASTEISDARTISSKTTN